MKTYKLRELLEIKNGRDHKGLNSGIYPVYGSGGIMRYVDSFLYDKPSVLLPRKGTLDNIQYADKAFWTVDTIYYTEVNSEKVNAYYLYNYLKLLDLSNLDSGTGVPSMTFDSYYNLNVKLPPLESQQKIAAVLSALDDKIALNRRMNAKLEQMAKRLYDYWFVQFDFPNADGKPYKSSGGKMEYNEVLKREIPAGWEVKSIFDACDLLYGFPYATEPFDEDDLTASKKPYKIVRIRDIQNNAYSAKTTEKVDDKYRTRINDLLIGMDGYFHMNFWSRNDDYINQRIVRLRKTCISTLILYFQIMPFIKFKEEKTKGSTVGHLSDKDLKQLFVVIPNNEFLSNHFETILNMKTRLNAEIEKLSATRDRLLPLLMNGQVEVR